MTTEYRPPAGWLYSTRRIYTEGAENENREETLKTLVVDDQRVFVSDTDGPEEYAGFFEDDGDTGYLYVSDRREKNIVQHLQIYVNSPDLSVNESDVEVVWSTDRTRCGVRIWGALRGVIDVRSGTQARAFVTSRDSDPIHAAEWLAGFD